MKVKLPERRAVSGPGRQDGGAPAAAPLKTRGGKTARRVLRRIGYIAACCCCVGVMLASVAAVVFASYLARLSGTDADMPDLYVLKMAENSIVYAADPTGGDWTEYAVFTGENDRVWTPLEQFPQTLRDAVVSVEDRNFWNQRFGINPGRILGAAVNELTGHRLYGSRQGASTLEQQLIENLTGDSAQSISGKFKEISRAIVMAGRYSKDMILEAYLNIAPLTGTLSGMQAGAQQYFGKDASQLTLAESATLASIPRSPVAYSPYSNPEKLLERRNWVLGLMLVSCFSLLLLVMERRELELFYTPYNRYIWMYAAIYLVGTWFSVTRSGSLLGGCLTVAFTLFALVLENSITTRRQLDTLVLLLVLAGTAVALYGICQYIFGWGYQSGAWVDSDMFSSITFRATSTLENPNMLGQYLILVIALGGAGLLSAKGWGMRVVYFCCCGLMCVCMLLTFARGAWLGLLFAGLVFLMFLQPRLLLLSPLLLVAMYFVLPETVIQRFTSIGNLGDQSTSYRVYIWMGTLAMLKDYWLCGIGPGDAAFNLVYPRYSYSGVTAPHSHNLFLQIMCDAGVIALVIFVLLLFHFFRDLCAAFCREKDSYSRLHQAAVVAGMAGFMVQAMTDYSFYNYRVMFLFWVFIALGGLLARRGQLPEEGRRIQ